MRIAVAMSGGVDSSYSAALLLDQGHEVVGLTLKVWDSSRCCSLEDAEDARRVARHLGIPFYVVEARDQFEEDVIAPTVDAYRRGLTPNPCVYCNRRTKFRWLAARARALGCQYLATGHYARLEPDRDGVRLLRGVDSAKDQSYFLVPGDRGDLENILFPLGALTKLEVRAAAARKGLPVAEKPDSQDLCFVPRGGLGEFISARLSEPNPGEIVDTEGRVLGRHRGTFAFTVGQRKGLGVAGGSRLYVVGTDPESGRVVVGPRRALMGAGLRATGLVWLGERDLGRSFECTVKIRSTAREVACSLELDGDRARVRFHEPQFGIAPGQMAVFYQGDRVLGGAWIERVG